MPEDPGTGGLLSGSAPPGTTMPMFLDRDEPVSASGSVSFGTRGKNRERERDVQILCVRGRNSLPGHSTAGHIPDNHDNIIRISISVTDRAEVQVYRKFSTAVSLHAGFSFVISLFSEDILQVTGISGDRSPNTDKEPGVFSHQFSVGEVEHL